MRAKVGLLTLYPQPSLPKANFVSAEQIYFLRSQQPRGVGGEGRNLTPHH